MKPTKNPIKHPMLRRALFALAATALSGYVAEATPFASCITNNGSGTMTFYLNESGANVWITYPDGSTNANYNGVTTGTNLASGAYTFGLNGFTTYSINVYKVGTGTPSLVNTSFGFTPRGVAANSRAASPYFGRIYSVESAANGLALFNSDLSLEDPSLESAGVSWKSSSLSPYRISVAPDDFVMAGDASSAGAAVWRLDPNIKTNQLFLGPVGEQNALNAGVFGTIQSRPLLLGNITSSATLLEVDGDFNGAFGYNSLLVYSNITAALLPYESPPTVQGPAVGLSGFTSETLGDNEYPGLCTGPSGYIYCSTYRNNLSNPLLQIYDPNQNYAQIWNSYYNNGNADYFLQTVGGFTQGICDIAVSPDGRFVVGASLDNYFIICDLTNGIPDVGSLYTVTPTSFTGNGRAVAFDAADNIILSSSGLGLLQEWTLGITTTAVTTGNTNGSTSFAVTFPPNSVTVSASTNFITQGGSDGVPGTPTSVIFTLTRTNIFSDYSQPLTVNFTFVNGTAPAAAYTITSPAGVTAGAANTVVIEAGETSTNITVTAATNNVPRLQTTIVLGSAGGANYIIAQPSSASVNLQNTSTNEVILSAGAPTMYKAFSNDFASVVLTRLGDTNAPSYTIPASAFTYTGQAASGTDFTPMPAVTFNPGDLTHTPSISPLSNGVPPADTLNPFYYGNKSVTVQLTPAAGVPYETTTASSALTLLDNAENPLDPVIFSDPLTSSNDAAICNITYGTGDELGHAGDYTVEFGYDLTTNNPEAANNGLIGLPPSGATNALRISCNNNSALFSTTYGGGVNVYFTNEVFSGNYAVRFNLNVTEGDSTYPVSGVLFGINHNGLETNWWLGSGVTINNSGPWAGDGVWYWIQSPPGGAGGFGFTDFEEYTGAGPVASNTGVTEVGAVGAASFTSVFKHNLFTAPGGLTGGTPANNSPESATPADSTWADVEIKQVDNTVTMSIDKTTIFTYGNTNATLSKSRSGYLMLGYDAPIAGTQNQYVDSPDAAAYFSNLRVVRIGPPTIISITDTHSGANNNVTLVFTTSDGDDTPSSFTLQTNSVLTNPFVSAGTASFSQILTNNGLEYFQVTLPATPSTAKFFRIMHNPSN